MGWQTIVRSVRCFHAGKNAPCGASVMMYSYGNDSLQLQIK